METIPVVVEKHSQENIHSGTLGLRDSVDRVVEMDMQKLQKSVSRLTGQISTLFEDISSVGDFQLNQVQIKLEVNAEGGVALIGSAKAGASGAISLTFVKP